MIPQEETELKIVLGSRCLLSMIVQTVLTIN